MISKTTNAIIVSVETHYQTHLTQRINDEFVFGYHITIFNSGNKAVKLLSRHWYILDGHYGTREVIGVGVVGQQPLIEPDEAFKYNSYCVLNTEFGRLWGSYEIRLPDDNLLLTIDIPVFEMIVPYKLN